MVKRIDRTTCWRTAKQTLKTRSEGRSEREGQRGDGREQGGRDGVWWWTGRGGVVVVMMEAALSEPSGFQGEQKQSRSSLAATELLSFLQGVELTRYILPMYLSCRNYLACI